jgi:tetratricopeptide (TPR) repeat protein
LAVSDFQPERIDPSEIQEDAESIAEAELAAAIIRAQYYAAQWQHATGESEETRKAYLDKARETYQQVIKKFPDSAFAHFQFASLLVGAGEMDSPIEHLEKAIELDPQLKDAYETLGLVYRMKGENKKAVDTYRKAIDNVKDNLPFFFSLADAFAATRKTEEAEGVLLEACQQHARAPEAWFNLIQFYVRNRQINKADDAFEKGLQATENSYSLLRDVRGLYLRWDDKKAEEKALAVLIRTLDLYPQSPRLWLQLIHYYLTHNQKDKAREATEKVLHQFPFDVEMFTGIALAYMNVSDWDSAIAVLNQATEHHPGSVEVWQALARLYAQKGDMEKARECYRKILSLEPTRVEEKKLLARSYLAERNYERAIEEFQEAIRLFPNDLRLRVDIANAYLAAGQFEQGERVYSDLIKERPGNSDIYLLLANYYLKGDKLEKMQETINQAVQLEKEPARQARIYALMGQAALEKADLPTSLGLFQKAVETQPEDSNNVFALGRVYLLSGDREKGAEQVDKAIKLAPTPNPDWLLLLGDTYRALRKKDKADEAFSNAIAVLQQQCEKLPNNWMARFQLGQAYEKTEDDALAAEAYAESVKLQPDNGALRYKLATVYSGLHQHEKAQKQLEEAVKLESPKPEWFLLLGEVYGTLTKRDEAAQAFEKAIGMLNEEKAEKSQDSAVWAALGEAYNRANRNEEAVAAIQKAVELTGETPDYRLHILLARSLSGTGQIEAADEEYRKAASLLEEAAKKTPNDPDTYLRLGLVYQSLYDYAKSSEAFSKGIELAGGNASYTSYVALADSLDRMGKSDLARTQYETAYSMLSERIKHHPEDVFAYYMLGNVCDKLDKVDECEQNYKKAAELDTYFASAYNNLGYTWIERDLHIEEAVKLVQKALELEPDTGAYVDSLGWGYFKQGKLDEALAELLRALKLDNTDPAIYDHIADVYRAKSMIKEAIEYWQKALDMNPNDTKIKEKIEKNRTALPPAE